MVATDDEKAWITRSQNGDPEAFAALVTQYQKMIHGLTFRMTGSIGDAEDLAQETFIQAYQQIGRFRGEAAFSSWLYRIGVNRCLNWRKREQRRAEVHEEWSRAGANEAEPDRSTAGLVQEALLKLHPKQRAAIILTVYEGHNHAEAARILDCSETTVSWRVFAARRKLKRWLTKGKADDEEI